MRLSICIHKFFKEYLRDIKGVSPQTIKAYRDTFVLFLPFAANYHSIKIESLTLNHLSIQLILSFLGHLETERNNSSKTRNLRLAALKSFAKMIRLLYPEKKKIVEKFVDFPNKRVQKTLIGFLTHEEMQKVFKSVDLNKGMGFRDYTLLHLLFDSGARASEVASLKMDYFDPQNNTIGILGKGNRYRLVELWPRTVDLIRRYLSKYRPIPEPLYRDILFINQRGESLTRYGINWLCKKYLSLTLPPKRLNKLNPAHSIRHSCAVNMLLQGYSITDIKNRLGHDRLETTMIYLRLDLSRKREVQKTFIEYTQSLLPDNPDLDELLDWDNKEDILGWLDSL